MIKFQVPEKVRSQLAPFHREFQIAVALKANDLTGQLPRLVEADYPMLGIAKYEGGVKVFIYEGEKLTSKEICIRRDDVADDWDYDFGSKPQEQVVVDAINFVVAKVQKNPHYLAQYAQDVESKKYTLFDPLRSFFDF